MAGTCEKYFKNTQDIVSSAQPKLDKLFAGGGTVAHCDNADCLQEFDTVMDEFGPFMSAPCREKLEVSIESGRQRNTSSRSGPFGG